MTIGAESEQVTNSDIGTESESTESVLEVDPAALEAGMLEKANARKEDPAEMAATMFTLYLPRFHAYVDSLSNKGLRRLIKALIEHPLEDKPYHLKEQAEKEAFAIGLGLLDAKYVMVFDTYSQGMETLQNAAVESEATPVENTTSETNEGVQNG